MNQEESEQNEVDGIKKGADSTGKVMHVLKERLVICNEVRYVGLTSLYMAVMMSDNGEMNNG